jgi:hypothetical protein
MQVLREAQYLKHGQYGLGVVTQSNSERTTIDFELHGIKKFVTSLLVVELLPGQAPAKAAPARRTSKKTKTAPRAKSPSV